VKNHNERKLGAILGYVAIVLNILVSIVYTPILTRMLGSHEFGLYSLVETIVSYLNVLDLGFANAIIIYTVRYHKEGKKEEEQKLHGMFFIVYLVLGLIATIIGIILCCNIKSLFGNSMSIEEIEKAKILMILSVFNIALTLPLSIFSSIVQAYEKFTFSKILNIIRIILQPLIMIPLLLLGFKSIALVILITVLNLSILLLNMFYCFKKLNIKLKFKQINFKILKEVFTYSIWIFLNSVADKIAWSVDQFVLGIVSGTVAVAVYSIASKINTLYLSF